MYLEEPKVEFVAIDYNESMMTAASNCIEDGSSKQGGGSCIGDQDHSQGDGCYDTAPEIAG